MKYFASFRANNGSTFPRRAFEYSNKKEAIKDIRERVLGEHFWGGSSISEYTVWDENGICVDSATLYGNSERFLHDEMYIGSRIH